MPPTSKNPTVSPEPYPEFTALTADPTSVVSIENASDVAYTTATAKGVIDRPVKSNDVACHFEYITDEQFTDNVGNTAPGFQGATSLPCDTGNPAETPGTVEATGHVGVEAKLANLANDTSYHLRLAVSNAANADAKEAPSTFKTLKVDPPSVISTENASEVEYTRAKVSGEVERPNTVPDPGVDVTCNFEYVTQKQFEEEEFAAAQALGQVVGCETEPPENPITATGHTPVKATLGGLLPSTTYHLRIGASNQGGSDAKEAPATFTTQGPAPAPSVLTIDDASDIHIHSAKVTGSVERPAGADPGLDVNCRFEYVTQAQFEEEGFGAAEPFGQVAGCVENPITSLDGTAVSANVEATIGLSPGTTYHLRLAASNAGGTDTKEAAATFTSKIPVLTLDPPLIGYTTAQVSGTIKPEMTEGCPPNFLQYWVQYSTEPANPDSWVNSNVSGDGEVFSSGDAAVDCSATTPEPIGGTIKGLTPGTTYSFRLLLFGGDFNVTSPQPYPEVTTKPVAAPTATLDVTGITANGAHISGTVNANAPGPLDALGEAAYETAWHIECVPACDRLLPAGSGVVKAGEGAKAISVDASELDANTSYEVKLIATNARGSASDEKSFPTPLVKPTVKQFAGAPDGNGGYTLQGTVNPNNSKVTTCEFKWGPDSAKYAFKADCSPMPGEKAKALTVEAHLTGLTPGVDYHALLVATNAAGEAEGVDQTFVATVNPPQNCPNEELRKENGSEALPECRAYEMVTPPDKSGLGAFLRDFSVDGGTVQYESPASNIANSGYGEGNGQNQYVSVRGAEGWKTLANLNGPLGSIYAGPDGFQDYPKLIMYSSDFRSSIWGGSRKSEPAGELFKGAEDIYLHNPDGTFTRIGKSRFGASNPVFYNLRGASGDLSRVIVDGTSFRGAGNVWGPGVYEFVGTGNDQPRRVDLDNSGNAITTCGESVGAEGLRSAFDNAVSTDGSRLVFTVAGGCGAPNPPAREIWARVDATASIDVSASQCTRPDCNAPADATFEAATPDGSRVFFTTAQQLVNGDTDQTYDLYACELPSGTPTPIGPANPCASLMEVSGSGTEAKIAPPGSGNTGQPLGSSGVLSVSEDGSTVYFIAKGVLADNPDALDETAVVGDENLYVWRTDAAHPAGQTTFAGRLKSNDIRSAQSTPDGSDLVFNTANSLVPTDTDTARDVYRYDADTAAMNRVSFGTTGAGGNADAFESSIVAPLDAAPGASTFTPEKIAGHQSHPAVSNDGDSVIFATSEPLSPLDGNGASDVYLWKDGHVFLITTGSVGWRSRRRGISMAPVGIFTSTPRSSSSRAIATPSVTSTTHASKEASASSSRSPARAKPANPRRQARRPHRPPKPQGPVAKAMSSAAPRARSPRAKNASRSRTRNTRAKSTVAREPVISREVESEHRSEQPINHCHLD